MANYCSVKVPQEYLSGGGGAGASSWGHVSTCYTYGGKSNPECFATAARGATKTPYYFDADQFGIVCQAFPSAGSGTDPLISQAAAIDALNGTVGDLQATVATLTSPSETSPERIADMAMLWGLFLVVIIIVFCSRRFLALWDRQPHEG